MRLAEVSKRVRGGGGKSTWEIDEVRRASTGEMIRGKSAGKVRYLGETR